MSQEQASPTQQLAERLMKRLVEAQLIRASSANKISEMIFAGKMSGSEWRLELELAKGKEKSK